MQTSLVCHRAWSLDYGPDSRRQGSLPGALGKVVGVVQLTHRTAMYGLWYSEIAKAQQHGSNLNFRLPQDVDYLTRLYVTGYTKMA